MLQRLFARHASEERIEDAVDHGKTMEDQDALRERSQLILERLARKQATARQEEIEARRAAREAAERAAEEAKIATPPAEEAETPAAAEASVAEPDSVTAQAAEESAAAGESAQQDFEAPTAMQEEAVHGVTAPAADATAAERSDYFSDDAPLRTDAGGHAEPHYEAPRAKPPAGDERLAAEPSHSDPVADPLADRFAEPTAEAQPEHTVPDIHDDPEAMERIRKKAEEAKARIAARLQQMEADEHEEGTQTDPSNGRLDLGEDTPPVLPDDSDQ